MQRALVLNANERDNLKREICSEVCARIETLLAYRSVERAVSREEMLQLH